jgi:hypothetical protein
VCLTCALRIAELPCGNALRRIGTKGDDNPTFDEAAEKPNALCVAITRLKATGEAVDESKACSKNDCLGLEFESSRLILAFALRPQGSFLFLASEFHFGHFFFPRIN